MVYEVIDSALANLQRTTCFVGEMQAMRNSLAALLGGFGGAEERFPQYAGVGLDGATRRREQHEDD
jgi:hypothetical protein